MEMQNVTLSIPKHVLRQAKILAVRRNTSLSALLTHTLEDLVAEADGYEQARQSHLALLEQAADLGTNGQIPWKRGELHER